MNELKSAQSIKHKIEKMFKDYVNQHNEEPLYVSCCIKYLDNGSQGDVIIKLSTDLDILDDSLFFYCNSLSEFKSLCFAGDEDFIITDVYEFSNEI